MCHRLPLLKQTECRRLTRCLCVTALLYGILPCSSVASDLVSAKSIAIAGGTMVTTWRPGEDARQSLDVLVHFHGANRVVADSFQKAQLNAVLIVVNFHGLSAAYATPFRETPGLFQKILEQAMRQVREAGQATADARWGTVCVSTFSAGFGAVRQILGQQRDFERITGLVAADSIYAGLDKQQPDRQVNRQHMQDFLRYAELACHDKKTFVVTHTYLETPYASTFETADYLLQQLGIACAKHRQQDTEHLLRISRATKGQFQVLGYEGTDGPAHMQHLRNIEVWWQMLPLERLPM